MEDMSTEYFVAMLVGYVLTVIMETTVLLPFLSRRHTIKTRIFAGVWLTACTYPVVWLVLPGLFEDDARWAYLLVAETFAPVAECTIFWFAFIRTPAQQPAKIIADEWSVVPQPQQPANRWDTTRDMAAIIAANLTSFGIGELMHAKGWFIAILEAIQ
jgi:hypothetical protein